MAVKLFGCKMQSTGISQITPKFREIAPPFHRHDAADADDSGGTSVTLTDPIYSLTPRRAGEKRCCDAIHENTSRQRPAHWLMKMPPPLVPA